MEDMTYVQFHLSLAMKNLHEIYKQKTGMKIFRDKSETLRSLDSVIGHLNKCRGTLADRILHEERE